MSIYVQFELVHRFYVASLQIISVVVIDKTVDKMFLSVSLDISKPKGMTSMIIGEDFGSDRVTLSPRHDDVDTCDDGQPCIYLDMIYTNHQQFPSKSTIFIGLQILKKPMDQQNKRRLMACV